MVLYSINVVAFIFAEVTSISTSGPAIMPPGHVFSALRPTPGGAHKSNPALSKVFDMSAFINATSALVLYFISAFTFFLAEYTSISTSGPATVPCVFSALRPMSREVQRLVGRRR